MSRTNAAGAWTLEQIFEAVAGGALDETAALALIHRVQGQGATGVVKTTRFRYGESLLREHRLEGREVFLAALHLSLAVDAARDLPGLAGPLGIENFRLTGRLDFGPGETLGLGVALDPEADHWTLRHRASRAPDETPVEAARAVVRGLAAVDSGTPLNLAELMARAGSPLPGEMLYRRLGEGVGPGLRTIRELYAGPDFVLAKLAAVTPSATDYELDPALLYGAHFAALLLSPETRAALYLPMAVERAGVFGPLRGAGYSLARLVRLAGAVAVHDIDVLDEAGRLAVRLEGFTSQSVGVPYLVPEVAAWFAPLAAAKPAPVSRPVMEAAAVPADLRNRVEDYLCERIRDRLEVPTAEISRTHNFMDLGVDSTMLIRFTQEVEKDLGIELYPTLLFEYQNISDLAGYLLAEQGEAVGRYFPVVAEPESQPSATETATVIQWSERWNPKPAVAVESGAGKTLFEHPHPNPLPEGEGAGSSDRSHAPRGNAAGDAPRPVLEPEEAIVPTLSGPSSATDAGESDAAGSDTGRGAWERSGDAIAIIGLGCRFAESPNPERFWENLAAGRRMSGEIPAGRFDWELYGLSKDEAYCRWGSFLEDVDRFDPLFFGISPREAELIDPQLRLFLEVFHETLEDAAQAANIRGTRTGLYLGVCSQDYYQNILLETTRRRQPVATPSLGNLPFTIANRTSYLFDLRGPSFCVDTACSSSLIALHLACEAIRRGECEMAVAGGVNLILNPFYHAGLCRMDALTHSGASRAFDAAADGYLRGEGVAALLLKPLDRALADGDRIHAVIRGSHTNHGGHASSFTAPRTELQSELLAETWRRCGIDPATLGLLEAHGTGTRLGDPIEVDAAVKAFRRYTERRGFCALGTVKANIGHGEAVAGLAGVVKAALSLQHRLLPAMPDFQNLNPYINLADSPLYINTAPQPWPSRDGQPRRAGVSSFGIGGAYAHVVLEEAPEAPARPAETPVPALPVPFSAKTPEQLRALLERFADFLGDAGRLAIDGIRLVDLARTLQLGRAAHQHRIVFVAADLAGLRGQITAFLNGTTEDGRTRFTGIVREAMPEPALPAEDDAATLAGLWAAGYRIDWSTGPAAQLGRIVSLPATPFADERYWFGARPAATPESLPVSMPASQALTPPEPARETLLFEPVWQPKPLAATTSPDSGGAALLLGSNESLRTILAPLMSVQTVEPGAADFDSASEADHRWVVAPFKNGTGPLYVFFDGDGVAGDSLSAAPRALLLLVRALLAELPRRDIRLTYHGRADSGDAPRHAWATGFLGAARLEHPPLAFRWVLFAGDAPEPAAQAELLWREWAREISTEPCCRYVDGQRQVRNLRECPPSDASFPCRAGAVVLVTGGLGGLGLVFARHLAKSHGATVIVAGRSAESPEAQAVCAAARAEGLVLHPLRMDVADAESVRAGIAWIKARFGALHGIVHSAGVLRDGLLFSKSPDDFEAVFAPKAHGAELLDAATAAEPLDFFVLCGSLAGLQGNPGQSDYAAANAYLDAFARRRAALVRQGLRRGRSLAIDWPYWAEGGMRLPAAVERMLEAQGLYALPTDAGLAALDRALALDGAQIAVFHGLPERVRALAGVAPAVSEAKPVPTVPKASGPGVSRAVVLAKLLPVVAGMLNMPPARLDPDEPLEHYGLDSLLITTLNAALEQAFGALPKTLFFEVRTLSALADWLAEQRPERFRDGPDATPSTDCRSGFSPTPSQTGQRDRAEARPTAPPDLAEPIAIIGLAGRYPGARDVDEFWENLRAGRDSVGEIPAERWNWREFYDPQPGREDRIYAKWGAFLEDCDKFDPLFFGISPKEAAFMDPQERLFLETVWATFEDAGYTRRRLAETFHTPGKGTDIGVFAGVTWDSYQLLGAEQWQKGARVIPSASFWSIANRVSYVFDLSGPSMPVDTACSASLVAVHLACESLRRGECRAAIAGGVNLYLHPSKYLTLCQARFLSTDGRCRSFGAGGDGFVPGEGVGAVLLKPLGAALADGDTIHGLIRGSAVNHGGRTHGYTVPNPNAQAALVREALSRAGVDPASVGYIEAHGTGTALGDPVEISGLAKAFEGLPPGPRCAIGSVKSNIGHLESAAGIAGLTKVLLQMRHRALASSLHAEHINPAIDFAATPFHLNRALQPWEGTGPLRAGISSFGAGGVNAHVVVESHPVAAPALPARPELYVLSARTPERLRVMAENLLRHLERPDAEPRPADLAHTLRVGREAMAARLAVLADSLPELRGRLRAFVEGRADSDVFVGGNPGADSFVGELLDDAAGRDYLDRLLGEGALAKLAKLWVRGADLDWRKLPIPSGARFVSLPTYPFERVRCWLTDSEERRSGFSPTQNEAGQGSRTEVRPTGEAWVDSVRDRAEARPTDQTGRRRDERAARRRCRKLLRRDDLQARLSALDALPGGLHLQALVYHAEEAVGTLAAPLTVAHGAASDPALCAAAWQAMAALWAGLQPEGAGVARPRHPAEARVLAEGTAASLYVKVRELAPDRLTGDVELLAADGRVLVAFDGLALVRGAEAASASAWFPASEATDGAAPSPNQTELLDFLQQEVAGLLDLRPEQIEPGADLGTLGFSSIQGMRLIQALETRFGLKLYASELAGRRSLAALVDYLAGQTPETVSAPVLPPPSLATASAEAASPISGERLVFILSAPRSGSTLLRVMLAGHPGLFCPPELHLAGYATLAERAAALDGGRAFLGEGLTRAVMELQGGDAEQASATLAAWTADGCTVPDAYARLLDLAGGRLCVDKSPSYGTDGAVLARLAGWFPEARFIFLTRHPGAVMASLVDNRFDRMLGLAAADPWHAAEQTWQSITRNLLAFGETVAPARWRRVAYEDLVREPEAAMRGLCEFLGLDFDPATLTPYAGSRMTDGLHAESLGIGDPNFLRHQAIDPALAERWRIQAGRRIEYTSATAALAAGLGYRLAGTLPLSPAQQRFFARHGDASEWSIVQRVAVETAEPLEPARFAASWRAVLSRHPQLSIRFERAADGWAARVAEPGEFIVDDIDAAHLAPDVWTQMAEEKLAAYHHELNVADWPLLRVGLARRGEGRYEVLWAVHHAIADGATAQLILRDVLAHYHGGTPALIQAGEFAAYCGTLAERFDAAEEARQAAFWRGHIDGCAWRLPTDFPEDSAASRYGAEREWAVDVYLDREPGGAVSLYEASALALYETLAKWTGTEAVPLAHRYHGRDLGEWGSFPCAVGLLACDYPLVLRAAATRPWAERTQDLRAALAALPRRGAGYEWLVATGRVPPVGAIAPVRLNFQTGFVIDDGRRKASFAPPHPNPLPEGEGARCRLTNDLASSRGAGHRATVLSTRTRQPDDWRRPYALDCIARWEGHGGRLLIRYAENLHTPDTIRALAGQWRAGLLACLREAG